MTSFYATPDVYIEREVSHPESSVSINSAIPAFVGYTEEAMDGNHSLLNKPTKIYSLNEYEDYFGKAHLTKFILAEGEANRLSFKLKLEREKRFILYHSLVLFFANGGTECYITSIGSYDDLITKKALSHGLDVLTKELEPTLLVIPEAVMLKKEECFSLQQKMLQHCGQQIKFRFAILDVHDDRHEYFISETNEVVETPETIIQKHREGIGSHFLQYGASYYPSFYADIVKFEEVGFQYFYTHEENKKEMFSKSSTRMEVGEDRFETPDRIFLLLSHDLYRNQIFRKDGKFISDDVGINPQEAIKQLNSQGKHLMKFINKLMYGEKDVSSLNSKENKLLKEISPQYRKLCHKIVKQINILPPSGAIAGIYARSDNQFSVGRAPANFTLKRVIQPVIPINNKEQEELNRPLDGKAINVIRAFSGKGTMVWGARTMDGNNPLWRYINVKRSMIHLQQSIKAITEKFVFKPNDEGTWVLINAAITNFLTDAWMEGVLKGGEPEEAFSVEIGDGGKMAFNDILDGFILITIKVAIVRPMEFIVVKFKQDVSQT